MKIYVLVKFSCWNNIGSADSYLKEAMVYNVQCTQLEHAGGIYIDKYKLKIEGEKQNIDLFLSFLRLHGFKIKNY